jgi:hypothetical protein
MWHMGILLFEFTSEHLVVSLTQFPIHKEKISLLLPSFSLIPLQANEILGLAQFLLYQCHFFVNNAIISLVHKQSAFKLKLAKFIYLITKFLP